VIDGKRESLRPPAKRPAVFYDKESPETALFQGFLKSWDQLRS